MGDVSSTLKLENGKHYRWIVEGEWRGPSGRDPREAYVGVQPHEVVSVEELRGSEPEWPLCTVVKTYPTSNPYLLTCEGWAGAGGHTALVSGRRAEEISEAWSDGTLEILYTPGD